MAHSTCRHVTCRCGMFWLWAIGENFLVSYGSHKTSSVMSVLISDAYLIFSGGCGVM